MLWKPVSEHWGPSEVPVYTAGLTRIPNERPLPKLPGLVEESNRQVAGAHVTAKLRSNGSTYNCAGLVLAFRRTWIDGLNSVEKYLGEDGYQRRRGGEDPRPGDVVVYRDAEGEISHLGIVLEAPYEVPGMRKPPLVLSKWGAYGEYTHSLMDVPEALGSSAEFWTDCV